MPIVMRALADPHEGDGQSTVPASMPRWYCRTRGGVNARTTGSGRPARVRVLSSPEGHAPGESSTSARLDTNIPSGTSRCATNTVEAHAPSVKHLSSEEKLEA